MTTDTPTTVVQPALTAAPVQSAATAFQQALLSGQQLAGAALADPKAKITAYAQDVDNAANALGNGNKGAAGNTGSTIQHDLATGLAELKLFEPEVAGFFKEFTALDWTVVGGIVAGAAALVAAAAHFGAHL